MMVIRELAVDGVTGNESDDFNTEEGLDRELAIREVLGELGLITYHETVVQW